MNPARPPAVHHETHGRHMMTPRLLPLLSTLVAVASGCVSVDRPPPPPPPDPYGDIAFTWAFDGEPSCDVAGVDEVDIAILQGGEVILVIEREPCIGSGLILTDFLSGRYEVELDAFNRRSELLYSGGFSIRVEGGRENDVGLVNLEPLFTRPPETGDLAFFWAFRYPANEAIIACDVAGVVEVDVVLEGPGGARIAETFACGEDGAVFQTVEAGRWTLHLDAFGRYRTQDLHLYGLTVDVDVLADREVDLGDLVLERDDVSFADIQVEWGFNATTCEAEGLQTLQLSITREGLSEPEDVTTVDCVDLTELRQTFVPGTYTIRLRGEGAAVVWSSTATLDLAPDTVAVVPLQLAPAT